MEATKFLSSTLPSQNPQLQVSSGSSTATTLRKKLPRKPTSVVFASASRSRSRNYEGDYEGRMVDEDMIVLRMRIREMKMSEARSEPPSNWTEWEKKYYANNGYDEDVCEAVGLLQNYLMNLRPGLALGLVAIVASSLFISTGLAFSHAIHIAHMIIFSGL